MMSKLPSTLRMAFTLFMARTFGRYEHSVWNGQFTYARYTWRGKSWAFPLEPIDIVGQAAGASRHEND